MEAARQVYGAKIADAGDLLVMMRKEFIEIVDEIAKDSITDQGHYEEVQRQVLKRKSPAPVAKATVSHDVDSDSPLFSSESDSESLICDLTKKAHLPSNGDKKRMLMMSKVAMIRERRQQVFCWTCRMKILLSNPQKKESC